MASPVLAGEDRPFHRNRVPFQSPIGDGVEQRVAAPHRDDHHLGQQKAGGSHKQDSLRMQTPSALRTPADEPAEDLAGPRGRQAPQDYGGGNHTADPNGDTSLKVTRAPAHDERTRPRSGGRGRAGSLGSVLSSSPDSGTRHRTTRGPRISRPRKMPPAVHEGCRPRRHHFSAAWERTGRWERLLASTLRGPSVPARRIGDEHLSF